MKEQGARTSSDGPVSAEWNRSEDRQDDRLVLRVTTDGKEQVIEMTTYNAVRAFGLLALLLEVELPSRVGKKIRMGER